MKKDWFVELLCDAEEIEVWKREFPSQGNPWVQDFKVPDGNGELKVISGVVENSFEDADSAALINSAAADLFLRMKALLIGARTIPQQSNARVGAVYGLDEQGVYRGNHFLQPEGHVALTIITRPALVEGVGQVGSKPKRAVPEPSAAQRILSNSDAGLNSALVYLGKLQRDDWWQLYMAFEALGKERFLMQWGLSQARAKLIGRSINWHRHHQSKPLDFAPLSFEECFGTIHRVIQKLR